MQHPYQCIAAVQPPSEQTQGGGYLLAGCGPELLCVSLDQGEIVSRWSSSEPADVETKSENGDQKERPVKKQKTSKHTTKTHTNIIKLTLSPDQRHVVVVTDDKILHVLSIQPDGRVEELSQRCMPKRPCAVHVLPDNATIICGDKFGDVYSLPLLPSQPAEPMETEKRSPDPVAEASAKEDTPAFKPSATNLTVHTKRNRQALEAQMKQKDFSAKKEPLKFEHKLLLGHVSMLTDVLYAAREIEGKQRGYIITADRDEHIRISRGPPQSHIIEGYCLGHTEFVSKLCLIPGTDLLVSGGGDEELYVWDWPSFKLRRKYDLYGGVADAIDFGAKEVGPTAMKAVEKVERKVVVSGLWTAPFINASGNPETALLVACERVPALFIIPVNRLLLKRKQEITELTLEYPPLDVTCVGDTVLVSVDAREGVSTTEGYPSLQAYKFRQADTDEKGCMPGTRDDTMHEKLQCLMSFCKGVQADDKALDELLYNVATLRKRRGWDAPGVPAGGGEEAMEGAEDVED